MALIAGSVYGGNGAALQAGDSRNAVGGWIGFVSFIVLVVELGVIVARFINFAFMFQYPLLILITVSGCTAWPQSHVTAANVCIRCMLYEALCCYDTRLVDLLC